MEQLSTAEIDVLILPTMHGKKHSPARRRYIMKMLRAEGFWRKTDLHDIENRKRPEKLQKLMEEKGVKFRSVPFNMADWLVVMMLEHLICGARLPNKQGFCLKPPTDPEIYDQSHNAVWRCYTHGGRDRPEETREIHRGNAQKALRATRINNAASKIMKRTMKDVPNHSANMRSGFYSDCLLPGEAELIQTIDVDSLDEEIRMAKIRLRRLQCMQVRVDDAILELDPKKKAKKLELLSVQVESSIEREIAGSREISKKVNAKFAVPDYNAKINALQGELGRMVKTRFNQLLLKGADLSPEERAERARAHLNKIMDVHTSEIEAEASDE